MQNLQNIVDSEWFIPLLIWTIIWKGIALWKCGRNNQLHWFIAILIINTVGILEMIYIFFFQQKITLSQQYENHPSHIRL